ncbi:MAG TPA: helix-turn-helix transcriptional regulator [Fluviicola sp.]|nr:helix-turn-helix transcriptional regulator [Fluviicola sp.]
MVTFVIMEIKDRIRMIIDSHRLTAGAFADKIGVQRSNVSHVLSGRNKPSFEFVEKMLLAFPKVQAHWLLTGKQQVTDGAGVPTPLSAPQSSLIMEEEPPLMYKKPVSVKAEKTIVKIVVFYDDFTFDTHLPNEQ